MRSIDNIPFLFNLATENQFFKNGLKRMETMAVLALQRGKSRDVILRKQSRVITSIIAHNALFTNLVQAGRYIF